MKYSLAAELLPLIKTQNIYIDYLAFYPSREYVEWKHFKSNFTFNNDFMMNRELHFCKVVVTRNDFGDVFDVVVTRNDFGDVFPCRWVILFVRVSY